MLNLIMQKLFSVQAIYIRFIYIFLFISCSSATLGDLVMDVCDMYMQYNSMDNNYRYNTDYAHRLKRNVCLMLV